MKIEHSIPEKQMKSNIETRIANRLQSIFAAFGQVVNDFYLEAGIYFVGAFNAALVAWAIYTDQTVNNQPALYAIILSVIAFIAVEGLTVYLVGAAAKTNNGWLWFFSVVFATFFTFAHYQEAGHPGIISWYITLAIPFFAVVGYWARTLKADTETSKEIETKEHEAALERQRQLEDEERARKQLIEDEERRQKLELERLKLEQRHAEKLAKIETSTVQKSVKPTVQSGVKGVSSEDIINAVSAAEKPVNITKLADSLQISRTTLYSKLNSLVDSGQMIKNGNGYEPTSQH